MSSPVVRNAVETWRDWLPTNTPEPALLTRDKILARVEEWPGKPVDERTLRYWQDEGVIPRPTLEGDAGQQRALYPWWVADLIVHARRLQWQGAKLKDLPSRTRDAARRLSCLPSPDEEGA